MADQYETNGKEVLLNHVHFADCTSQHSAEALVEQLNAPPCDHYPAFVAGFCAANGVAAEENLSENRAQALAVAWATREGL